MNFIWLPFKIKWRSDFNVSNREKNICYRVKEYRVPKTTATASIV
jgi:hypothetical protein